MKNIVSDSKRIVVFDATAAANTTLTSSVIDMDGHNSAVFQVLLGTLTTGQTLGVLQVNAGNLSNGSDMAALAGATITVADADASKMEVIEVVKPAGFRYLELVFTRNTQAAAVQSATVTLHGTRKGPDSDDATTVAQTLISIDPEYASSSLTVTTGVYGNTTTKISTTERTAS